ncbi:alpha/beta fold hydrolase [Niveibacterium sp. SC-1]|uniref:alpha/beta fold hydrolase n=1 Tax=Niveibacterium sp. SC-1 TaxID=3135646 RepID=UPI00311E12CF
MKPLNLFCLPGWAVSPRAFDALLAQLPECTVQLLDEGADPCAFPEDAVLLGWSRGAQRALHLAARRQVRGLILIAASPRFVAADDWTAALAADTVRGFREGFAHSAAATLKRFLALQALGDSQRATVLRQLGEYLLDAATPGLAASLDALGAADLRDETHLIDCPVLLIHGERDALMPVAAARWLALELDHADLFVFEDCGHAPHLSRAHETARLIRDFAGRL